MKSKIIVLFTLLLLTGCATISDSPDRKIYYTKANIWYTNPEDIRTTNYHMGAIIPFGSQVTIEHLSQSEVSFTTAVKNHYTIKFISKHSTITMKEYFDRYFSLDNPQAPESEYDKFSEMEKANVLQGNIVIGMSKPAVLSAYGFPPSHATPNLSNDYWRYWVRFRDEVRLCFTDNKVSKIEKVGVYGPPPGRERIIRVTNLLENQPK